MRERGWHDAIAATRSDRVVSALRNLEEGHKRFRAGKPQAQSYSQEVLRKIATIQRPSAAVIACSDSRVAPEIIFDQPLGGIFASRVPGNVASDSAKWMLEIAVTELKVPLVMVLGHTGCLAVGQLVDGKIGGAGGGLRLDVQKAVHRARMGGNEDIYRRAVIENVLITLENLKRDSFAVQKAIAAGELGLVGAFYDMKTGEVHLIE